MDRPKVGIGIIIETKKRKILIGKRKGSHAPYFSIPGGHLELGESFETAAIREAFEETGLKLNNPKVICVTNNLKTYQSEGLHYISVSLYCKDYEGEVALKEPDKCEYWQWVNPEQLPYPQFDASEYSVACFLENAFYLNEEELP